MNRNLFLLFFLVLILIKGVAHGQELADFEFRSTATLLKNDVGEDATSINPNAKSDGEGVFTSKNQNINIQIKKDLFKGAESIYLEFDVKIQETFVWFINSGFQRFRFGHLEGKGLHVRYSTSDDPDSIIESSFVAPLERGERAVVAFLYDQENGVGYIIKNNQTVWSSDEKDRLGNPLYKVVPGATFFWPDIDGYGNTISHYVVADAMDGEGSTIPSLYRFRAYSDACREIATPQVENTQICGPGPAMISASGGEDGTYRWYLEQEDKEAIEGAVNSTFETPLLENTTTFYVSFMRGPCESDRVPVTVEVLPLPNPPSVQGAENCGPGQVTLTAGGGADGIYRWYRSATDPTPIEGAVNSTYTTNLNTSKTFYVAIAGEQCESERIQVEAIIHPVPAAPLSQTIDQCGPGLVAVNVQMQNSSDAAAYRWYRRQEDSTPSQEENSDLLNVEVSRDTVLYVSSSSGNCESARVPIYIKVHELPELEAGDDKTIIKGESIQLLAGGDVTSVRWSPSTGLDLDNVMNPQASPPFTISYVVTGTNAAGCEISDTVTVHVVDKYPVPNAFSPNQDGLNDFWEIPKIEQYPSCKIMIFNRWGNQVFYSEGYASPWDGTHNGTELPTGTYYFTLQLNEELEIVKGTVSLIR